MSAIADMVEQMMDRGMDRDMILLAIRTAEDVRRQSADSPQTKPADEQAERRRAADRERQRVRRHPQTSADSPQTVTNALTLSSLTNLKDKKEKKVRAAKAPLSADWAPSDSHFEAAAKLGISRKAVEWKAEDLRLWALSSGELKSNWEATFHGFLRRDADKLRKFGAENGKPTVVEAMRNHIEGGIGFGPKPSLFPSGASGGAVRVLPEGGGERSGGLHGGNNRDLVRIYTGSNPACDGPEDGAGPQDKLAADRRRG